jgi:peptide/nickel transport system permease protein
VRYAAGRIATGIGTLLVATVVVFVAIHLVPGSYADIVAGPFATPAQRAHVTADYGLDQPLPVQYAQWLGHAVTGDLGASFTGQPVTHQLERRLPVTAELTVLAALITVLVGFPLALLAGLSQTRWARGASRFMGAAAISVPDFVLGSMLLYLFSRYALGLRVGEYVPLVDDPIENLRAMLLPALTLSIFGIALVVRTGRDAVASVMGAQHVAAAVARGESTRHIVRHHVLRNAMIPVITVLAVYAGYLMGGAVIIENLFSLPGIGAAVLNAVDQRDYALVQGTVLVAATAFIVINMLADLTYGVIDPRVRTGGRP